MTSEVYSGLSNGCTSQFHSILPRTINALSSGRSTPVPTPSSTPTPRVNHDQNEVLAVALELEQPSKCFYPGQTVRGRLHIHAQETIGIQYIRIAAIGGLGLRSATKHDAPELHGGYELVVLNTGVRVTRQGGGGKDHITGRSRRERWRLSYDRVTLPAKSGRYDDSDAEQDDGDAMETSSRGSRRDSKYASMSSYGSSVDSYFMLDTRSHEIPFALPIPRNNVIPPSYKSSQCQIQYEVVALLHYETMDSSIVHVKQSRQLIRLASLTPTSTPLYNSPIIAKSPRQPVTTHQQKKLKSMPTSAGWIEASAYTPRRAFLPSDAIPLSIKINNYSDFHPCQATVEAALVQHLLNSTGLNIGNNGEKINGVIGVFDGISERDQEVNLDMDSLLSIPGKCCSTIFSDMTQGMLEVEYKVRIKVTLTGFVKAKKKFSCLRRNKIDEKVNHVAYMDFPIVIGSLRKCDI
ncbi:hypothetical protein INT43_006511 [Umbelopsis isabellina]|uniref:Arrestin C-terminal-like domain-containing protein n=1 Tax=Mortierella isabellina TaxID=91625 RepID=A0A8H7Q0X4_MORIS|nr:hypothetical protein INT43_006511 [Umbelopsis isabellina]